MLPFRYNRSPSGDVIHERLWRVWDHFEEGFIAFLLAAMTLVTFVYVILNNLYTLFYDLATASKAPPTSGSPSVTSSSVWPSP